MSDMAAGGAGGSGAMSLAMKMMSGFQLATDKNATAADGVKTILGMTKLSPIVQYHNLTAAKVDFLRDPTAVKLASVIHEAASFHPTYAVATTSVQVMAQSATHCMEHPNEFADYALDRMSFDNIGKGDVSSDWI